MNKILNLVYPEKSDIKYKISKFPSGQQNIVLDLDTIPLFDTDKEEYQIKSRLNNWLDLELISCSVASLREINKDIKLHLYVPFIDGRQDRKFEKGGNNYLKTVLAPVINSLGFKTITSIDPHSYVTEGVINNFKSLSNLDLVKWVMMNEPFCSKSLDDIILVSPDNGASHKIYKLSEQIGYKGDIITCSKERDNEGKLTKVNVPINETNKDFIIIDDICDGGATFLNIAKEFHKMYGEWFKEPPKLYLIVTHGIFSAGFEELSKYFDGVYSTNSYKDINYLDNTPWQLDNKTKEKFKQLDVF
jgi:ribose-phosphate pyrophosphokinase